MFVELKISFIFEHILLFELGKWQIYYIDASKHETWEINWQIGMVLMVILSNKFFYFIECRYGAFQKLIL